MLVINYLLLLVQHIKCYYLYNIFRCLYIKVNFDKFKVDTVSIYILLFFSRKYPTFFFVGFFFFFYVGVHQKKYKMSMIRCHFLLEDDQPYPSHVKKLSFFFFLKKKRHILRVHTQELLFHVKIVIKLTKDNPLFSGSLQGAVVDLLLNIKNNYYMNI